MDGVDLAAASNVATSRRRDDRWIDAAIVATCLVLAVAQFATNRIMSGFDSGVYFGAASQFVAGHLPYRDFVFVQPPGSLVLLSPWALIGHWTTLTTGFILARGFSAVVVSAVAVLVSRLLRPCGRRAALLGGLAVALAPTATFEMTAVKLEPYCLALALAGAYAIMAAQGRDESGVRRSVTLAGIALGVAGAVKLWALLIFIALAVCVWRLGRPLLVRFVAWSALGFTVVAGPFFIASPSNFVNQVIVAQLTRTHNAQGTVTLFNRLGQLTGLRNTPLALTNVELSILFGAIAAVALAAVFVGGPRRLVDDFFLVGGVLTMGALLASKEFYNYYGYFLAPFLVGLVITSLDRLTRALAARLVTAAGRSTVMVARRVSTAVLIVALAGVGVVTGHHLIEVDAGVTLPTLIDNYVPSGSCVIFDDAIQGVLSNRLVSSSRSCPVIVDSGGLSMAVGGEHPLRSLALARVWRHDFLAAQYVVIAGFTPLGIPWTGTLYSWFLQQYHVVYNGFTYVIYRRN